MLVWFVVLLLIDLFTGFGIVCVEFVWVVWCTFAISWVGFRFFGCVMLGVVGFTGWIAFLVLVGTDCCFVLGLWSLLVGLVLLAAMDCTFWCWWFYVVFAGWFGFGFR